ncbi:MAG: hypothetical protein KKF74_04700 [Nanoarchaeota archaeon]|nr:hypothetical protein [Nanoarchaeota archaeon]
MKRITFDKSKENGWKATYIEIADKLFITKKIPYTANPKTVKENITVYLDETNTTVGIIIENLTSCFSNKKNFNGIIRYIKDRRRGEIVNIPYQENFFKPIFSIL